MQFAEVPPRRRGSTRGAAKLRYPTRGFPAQVGGTVLISASEIRCQSALRVIDSLKKSVENRLP
ncbi:hypothetical protein [Acidiphilium sp. PA]|uniref:hypothetical protein n=1 Tax=Acidiphilium sp. PA TaxID=2871705 RepID=UPI0038D2497D